MVLESETDIRTIKGRLGQDQKLADAQDISGGVEAEIKNVSSFTLYLSAGGAVDVTVEYSPDDGTTWYTAPESPVSFSGSGDDMIRVAYDVSKVKLTGSDTTNVTAQVREVV